MTLIRKNEERINGNLAMIKDLQLFLKEYTTIFEFKAYLYIYWEKTNGAVKISIIAFETNSLLE